MQYDLIVIGGGPGGYVAAIRASQLGMKTALVEKRELGGTCLNRGCVPTKTLMHTANMYREAGESETLGLHFGERSYDFAQIHERKNTVTAQLRDGIAQLLKANKVDVYQAAGQIVDAHTVQAGDDALTAQYILIAAGSVPAVPPISGADLPGVVTSDAMLEAQGVDCDNLLIIGGGVIGVEMASIYASLGKQVTIVEAAERILPPLDREISQNLSMILKKRGVEIYTSALVSAISQTENGLACHFTDKKGEQTKEADVVLISVGRRPCTAGLFSEDFAVDLTERGFIAVDDKFATSVPNIYAVGDVIGRIQLAHAAEAQGIAAVEYMSGMNEATVNYDLVPSCVYTTPEIASVGITADEAKKAGREVLTGKYVMNGNAKTLIEQQDRGFIKVVFDKETQSLIGAQLMCARATDLISELVTAVSLGLTREQLARTMRPHPTFCEGITEAVEAAAGHSIHTAPSRK
ncbi:MAG: dihydrolipoyl dehydrogenase [Peptococcaceae bacterium]|nr:dihydrolipoyl dehydrogenase [Peptococcaceae bacterium]